MDNINSIKTQHQQAPDTDITTENNVVKKNYFLKYAIPLAISFWFIDSVIHYYWYHEPKFEIIPTDGNDLWMRIMILTLLATFGLFADYRSKKLVDTTIKEQSSEVIARAKRQWELVVDSLPQLVIAMDDKARVTRVNRTIEKWGVGKVNEVYGLDVADLLRYLNDNHAEDEWISDWPYIWSQIKTKDKISRKVEKGNNGRTYLYTLRKVPNYNINKDDCFAVLVIYDITTRQDVNRALKEHARELEKTVNNRTLELKKANERLELQLRKQIIAKEKLDESQKCRLGLLRDLFNAQEIERKRIARELHDSIGQSLGATKFKIEELLINKQNLTEDEEYHQLKSLVETTKNAINEVRHISMDLRPAMLDDLGTLPTLRWFCREFSNTYSTIDINLTLDIEESSISENKKVVIYRIIQEAMNNIVKHSNATKIDLCLSQSGSVIKLFINDNGCGFDTKSKTCKKDKNESDSETGAIGSNFGLSSMRERAESTNGTFEFKSSPGNGTSIIVSWKDEDTTPLDEKITV